MCARVPPCIRVKRNLDARSDKLLYGAWHFLFFHFFLPPPFFFFFRNAPRYGFDKLSKPVRYIEEPSLRATKVFTAPDLSESK